MSDSTSIIADLLLTPNAAGQAAKANDMFNAASIAMLYALDPATTTGLTWGYIGGWLGDNQVANGTVTLTDDDDNYIVAAIATGVVSVSTATTNWDNDTDYLRLYQVTTVGGAIDEYEDRRQAIGGGGGGGGGDVATDPIWDAKGDLAVASGPDAAARLAVGSDGQVLIADSSETLGVKWGTPSTGSPGGSDTQVQFNDAGSFGGDGGLNYNKSTDTLTGVNLTLTGLALTAASASGGAGFRAPHGAAPSSPTNGDIWTTTTGLFARINGSTVGPFGSASPGGSNTQIQYNNAGVFAGSSNLTFNGTQVSGANFLVLTVGSGFAPSIAFDSAAGNYLSLAPGSPPTLQLQNYNAALTIGGAGNTAGTPGLLTIKAQGKSNGNGASVDITAGASVASGVGGNITLTPGSGPSSTAYGNIALGAAGSFGSGSRVIFIANAQTVPSGNPTGGGILYVDSGELKYRGSSGTVTSLGAP